MRTFLELNIEQVFASSWQIQRNLHVRYALKISCVVQHVPVMTDKQTTATIIMENTYPRESAVTPTLIFIAPIYNLMFINPCDTRVGGTNQAQQSCHN